MMPTMQFRFVCRCVFLLSMLSTAAALADSAATQPAASQPAATRPAGDLTSPKAMMLSYDALAGAGPEAYAPFYLTRSGDDERLVRTETRTDAILGMLQV